MTLVCKICGTRIDEYVVADSICHNCINIWKLVHDYINHHILNDEQVKFLLSIFRFGEQHEY